MSKIECHVCGATNTTLRRINDKGVAGVWACPKHLPPLFQKDPEVERVIKAITEARDV